MKNKNFTWINPISNKLVETNPSHPIEINNYPKLLDSVLTTNGLEYFHSLKRNYILGKEMSLDEYSKLRLLYVIVLLLIEIQKKLLHDKISVSHLTKKGFLKRTCINQKKI